MGVIRWALGLACVMALVYAASAQEAPVHGCGAAVSCRPLGFSTLGTNPNSLVFGGFRFGPGFQFYLVTPVAKPLSPEQPLDGDVRIFHLRNVTLLPPTMTPTPAATARQN